KPIIESPLRGIVYCELIGLQRDRALQTSEKAFTWLRRAQKTAVKIRNRVRAGLSPHAPYSAAGWLYERAAGAGAPLSTHLGELPEELEFLAGNGKRIREFLEEIGAWDEGWEPVGTRPADYLRRGVLRNADWLVAHGTYLNESDFWQ